MYANGRTDFFFRYQCDHQEGYAIQCQWDAEGITTRFGLVRGTRFFKESEQKFDLKITDVAVPVRLRLIIHDETFELFVQDQTVARFRDDAARFADGHLAFDRIPFAGPCLLDEVRITTPEPIPSEPLWPPFTAEMPVDLHGMDEPFRFRFEAWREPGRIRLNIRLTGGLKDKPEGTSGWLKATEELRRPYIRILSPDGRRDARYDLVNGTVGFRKSPDGRNFLFVPADTETPLETTVYLPEWRDEFTLAIGYEHYRHGMTLHLQGGPAEALIVVPGGDVIYAGAPLRADGLTLEVQSPADKTICRRIPEGHPLAVPALSFARNNHFFVEGEPVRFAAIVRFRDATLRPEELTVRSRLENAFREPMEFAADCALVAASDAISVTLARRIDAQTLTTEIVPPAGLPVGVYHLHVQVRQGDRTVAERRLAFEVMSEDVAAPIPPLASGLPALYCFPHETRGLRTALFCPWNGAGVDAAHYMTGTLYPVPFLRETRAWEIMRLYHRRVMAGLLYGTNDQALDANADVLAHVDLAEMWANGEPARYRYYLTKPADYHGTLLDALKEFLRSPAFRPEPGGELSYEAVKDLDALPLPLVHELLERHWTAWADFANDWSAQVIAESTAALRRINPRAGRFAYGPMPVYVMPNKTAFFTRQFSLDFASGWTRHYEFVFLEDYTEYCGYPIQRGPFALAAMKLADPGLKQYPEFYGQGACPVDGAVLYGSPPYGSGDPKPLFYRKRLLEFAYAAVWFRDGAFAFWQDNGFHTSMWRDEHFAEFLRTWAKIRRHRPVRPLRTAAFALSREACRAHPEYVHKDVFEGHANLVIIELVNTAEECVSFAYAQARADGQLAGFTTRLEDVRALDPADVHTLVLPPLGAVPDDQRQAVRRLHERGVSLMAFEDVTGLEDLFGVVPLPIPVPLRAIRLNPTWSGQADWSALVGAEERTAHPLCASAYRPAQAAVILDGFGESGAPAAPALVTYRTRWGRTALFAAPPTAVRRADPPTHEFGQASISELINRSMALVLRELGDPAAETTDGKLIGFWDEAGWVNLVVEEDAHPAPARQISPLVTFHFPLSPAAEIVCDKPFTITARSGESLSLRLFLGKQESAWITIKPA